MKMEENLFKIGDFVRIKPENSYAMWYTDEIFQIIDIPGYSGYSETIYIISIDLISTSVRKNSIYFGNVYQDSECVRRSKMRIRLEKLKQLSHKNSI